uniref:Uncharacterized protein n=1 Tax=Oryza sativa subsp. japonica TaxID=39947 RepID=Q6YVU6_ORYSJ|nr:hypothetical protein [Oryza sativa Japonica Group]
MTMVAKKGRRITGGIRRHIGHGGPPPLSPYRGWDGELAGSLPSILSSPMLTSVVTFP